MFPSYIRSGFKRPIPTIRSITEHSGLALGLSSGFVQTDYTAYYRYTFSPKTELYLSGGVSTFNGNGRRLRPGGRQFSVFRSMLSA